MFNRSHSWLHRDELGSFSVQYLFMVVVAMAIVMAAYSRLGGSTNKAVQRSDKALFAH